MTSNQEESRPDLLETGASDRLYQDSEQANELNTVFYHYWSR